MFHDIPSLAHLDRMTDSTGIIQHGIYNLPGGRVATRPTTTLAPCDCVPRFGKRNPMTACYGG